MSKRKVIGLCLVLILALFILVPGCAKPAPAPAPTPAPAPAPTPEPAPAPSPAPAPAPAKPIVLRCAHPLPPADAATTTDKYFAEEVNKRTNGRVTVEIYFGGALGAPPELLNLAKDGAVDISFFPAGNFASAFPLWAEPNSAPFSFNTIDQAWHASFMIPEQIPAVQEEIQKQNVKLLYSHTLDTYHLFAKKPLLKVEDLKGLKIRAWGADLPKAFEAVGAVGVQVGIGEVYESLQKGVLDATPFHLEGGYAFKVHEVAPDVCLWNILTGVGFGAFMNMDAWNGLPADVQQVILDTAKDTLDFEHNRALNSEPNAVVNLEAAGATIYEVPDAERQKWIDANPDFVGDWIKAMDAQGKGDAARQIRELWLEIIDKY
jgi:TRAP-type C4-dicarboxylate transport system substrate-binding protein